MAIIERSFFVFLFVILISECVHNATIDKAEKRIDPDSYIDALQKNHADDSLNCECLKLI